MAAVGDGRARLPRGAGEGRRCCGRAQPTRAYARRYFAAPRGRGSILGAPGTDFLWAGGRLIDAWPANPDENEYAACGTRTCRRCSIGGDLDLATPPQTRDARAAAAPPERPPGRPARARPHGRLLELPARRRPPPRQHLPRQRPGRHLALHAEPRSTSSVFPQTTIAKIVLAVLLGFAALTVLSLLSLCAAYPQPWRTRRQDRRRDPVARTRSCWASAAGSAACCSR